uniref:Uncharacterized protein n=1 Tax=Anopheles atroparvus TaxID=41427 RepID=A0AAG5CTB2_ANOAO
MPDLTGSDTSSASRAAASPLVLGGVGYRTHPPAEKTRKKERVYARVCVCVCGLEVLEESPASISSPEQLRTYRW